MDPVTLLGFFGAALILLAFILNQKHIWKDDYLVYDLVNFIGSAILIFYAVINNAWPFVILNGVWAAMSLRDMYLDLQRNAERTGRGFYKKWLK